MTNEEAEKVLKELEEVRPEVLNDEAKRLFEAIMKIADRKDEAEADLYEANNRINDLLDIVKQKDEAIKILLTAFEKEKEKNKKIEIIVNKLMPLAECSYWNYENHTCTHTCRGCDYLNEDNKRTSSGILIDKDRYCRLYEDGNAEKDTKFVNVEDLINRHLKEE
jgi:hypothetical protein